MKIVLNGCYGGFSLSVAALLRYAELARIDVYSKKSKYGESLYRFDTGRALYDGDLKRDDPILVQVVEEMGVAANGSCAKLYVVDVEPGTLYRIKEYDGLESLEEKESIGWSIAR